MLGQISTPVHSYVGQICLRLFRICLLTHELHKGCFALELIDTNVTSCILLLETFVPLDLLLTRRSETHRKKEVNLLAMPRGKKALMAAGTEFEEQDFQFLHVQQHKNPLTEE
jgi:hypothetical protein